MPDDLATALGHAFDQQALGERGVQAQAQGDALVDRLLCGDVFFGGNRHVSWRLAELPFRPLSNVRPWSGSDPLRPYAVGRKVKP